MPQTLPRVPVPTKQSNIFWIASYSPICKWRPRRERATRRVIAYQIIKTGNSGCAAHGQQESLAKARGQGGDQTGGENGVTLLEDDDLNTGEWH